MARIFIAATSRDEIFIKRILGDKHDFVSARVMSDALARIKEGEFDLVMIGLHFDQSRMFDLLRELHQIRYDTPVICFCARETTLTRTAHNSINVATKALGAWMYLDHQKYNDTNNPEDELRRVIERCITGEVRKEIQSDRMDIHKQREKLLRLRQALADKEWTVELEDRVAELREKLAQVLLELSELQIASIAQQELVAESRRLDDRVSLPVQTAENSMVQEETRIGIQESEQLGQEQGVVPAEEAKAKEGRRHMLDEETKNQVREQDLLTNNC
ncbi:MAG: hypothetical protein K2W95_13870 [Candidatus Obscuribacterales bacterium]|nr:hypothetical protein [Candidatus Obscuribacterales bacterium]